MTPRPSPRIRNTPRASDETALAALDMHRRGIPPVRIARRLGLTRSQVSMIVHVIRRDDLAESTTRFDGEPADAVETPAQVLAGYA